MADKISEAEDLIREESITKYAEKFQLTEKQAEIGIHSFIQAKGVLELCGAGESININQYMKLIHGGLKRVDMKGIGYDFEARKNEINQNAARDRQAARDVLARAHDALHGKKEE